MSDANKPNVGLLNELFHTDLWVALRTEIEVCRDNALTRLKREDQENREYQAGAVTAYEKILSFEDRYKNADLVVKASGNG